MIKPLCNYLCERMVNNKLFITFIRSFVVLVSCIFVSLTYDNVYSLIFMVNDGKRRIIYDNQKLVFNHYKLHNVNIIANIFL